MGRFTRSLRRASVSRIALGLAVLVAVQAVIFAVRAGNDDAAAAGPSPAVLLPITTPSSTPTTASPSPSASPKRSAQPAKADATMFGGLGAWVDGFDYPEVEPGDAIAVMRRAGVRTLYLQTGRYNSKFDVDPAVGKWIVAAHDAGMKAVGWYMPAYEDMAREQRRTIAIARYRFEGHRFDGLGIDIEYKARVRNPLTWSSRVARNAEAVRKALGRSYAIAAITPPPLQMAIAPLRWAAFPWKRLAAVSDAFVLMSYWSFRHDCPEVRNHCPYGYTRYSVEQTRQLIGDRKKPIHVVGGEAEFVDAAQLRDFARGVRDSRAEGASLYDYMTTDPSHWASLARLYAR